MIDEETERERGGEGECGEEEHPKCGDAEAGRREPIHERRHELDCLKQSSSQQVQSRKQNTQWLLKILTALSGQVNGPAAFDRAIRDSRIALNRSLAAFASRERLAMILI